MFSSSLDLTERGISLRKLFGKSEIPYQVLLKMSSRKSITDELPMLINSMVERQRDKGGGLIEAGYTLFWARLFQ